MSTNEKLTPDEREAIAAIAAEEIKVFHGEPQLRPEKLARAVPTLLAALDAAEARDAAARAALEVCCTTADSHYAHFDRQGTAGANCPACHARRDARAAARAILRDGTVDRSLADAVSRATDAEAAARDLTRERDALVESGARMRTGLDAHKAFIQKMLDAAGITRETVDMVGEAGVLDLLRTDARDEAARIASELTAAQEDARGERLCMVEGALRTIEALIGDAVDHKIRTGRMPPLGAVLSTIQDTARAALPEEGT